MNNIKFIDSVIKVVRNEAISDTLDNLVDSPGRSPSKEELLLTEWYSKLSDMDKNFLKQTIIMAIDNSLFGIFAVIDGVRTVENDHNSAFELKYINIETKIQLKANEEYLHDIYN